MTIINTWFGEIELHNGQIVRSNVLQTDAVAIALRLQREEFTDLDKQCKSRLREMAIQLGLVTSEHDYISLLRAVAIQRAKEQIIAAFSRPDARIVQLIGGIDDIDESINLLSERLLEWDVLEFNISSSGDVTETDASQSIIYPTLKREFIESIERLSEVRKKIAGAIELEMRDVAPNLSSLAGELLGARLIAQAGSLESLARMPASKIQVTGASKALFKHLQYGAKPPKHGIIYQHPLIRGSPLGKRGKIARTMAAKLAIAARLDFYSKKAHPDLLAQMEKRVREINNPKMHDQK
ncbi:MAG: rRNA biogenesis protein [Euryarchaeota archaeon]|nr:rRNA biogenesis protein [Euryarchaeota archaeon]